MPEDSEGTVRRQEFGKEVGLVHEVVVTGRKVGADRAFWSTLAHDEELFRKVVGLVKARPAFRILVDYSLPLEDMIRAGNYDWVGSSIIQNFPSNCDWGVHGVTAELFHFDRTMNSDEAIAEMEEQGYRPATIVELLAFGAEHPELQREFPIFALGSVSPSHPGPRCVPYLSSASSKRHLGLARFDDRRRSYSRLLAVLK